jgi:hypothetical protein
MVRFHESLTPLMESIAAVEQYPDNPNNGDVEAIATSMEINGVFAPVVAQKSTGYILAGNHRYAALLSLGEHRIPVLWVDVDDVAARKIMLADNRTAALAEMDLIAVGEMLEEINANDPILGLLGTGYDTAYLERLRAMQMDTPLEFEDSGFAKQRSNGNALTCPKCGFEFGGGHR